MVGPVQPPDTSRAGDRVAVVIVSWNSAGYLPDCLDSLAAQTVPPAEVLVVDSGSSDGSAELVRRDYPDVEVHAVHEGTVVFAERFRGYGLMVVVDHGGKHHSLYAHLAEVRVEDGQKITGGDVVGLSGQGSLGGPGIYFEMRHGGRPEDPLDWLRRP